MKRTTSSPALGYVGYLIAGVVIVLAVAIALSAPTNSEQALTPKPSSTQTKQPTQAPTITPKPVTLNACVTGEAIRIRKGPGTDQEVIGGLASKTCIAVLGRNQDSSWLYIVTAEDLNGWVASWLLTVDGNIELVPVRDASSPLSLVPTSKPLPTATIRPPVLSTSTIAPPSAFLCSESAVFIGTTVTCQIERASCDYRPDVDGSPTFCNDRPYPNQEFTLVVFDQDWSDLDGECLLVRGMVELYGGELQIKAVSRSQVSFCE